MSTALLGVETSMVGQAWRPRLDDAGHRRAMAIAQVHGVPDILARVLAGRDIDVDTAESHLNPALRTSMPDPNVLRGMADAVGRLGEAIRKRETVAILGDYDVDGAASSALMAGFLRTAGLDCAIHIPDRLREGYGPSLEAVRAIAAAGATLLITVDCGSTSDEALSEGARLGVDCVVIDHHQIGPRLPPAAAVVNPNCPDDLSGLGHLCAAGVVFMVLVALNRALKAEGFWTGGTPPDLLEGLDLVALATVADVVPLRGLNRAFVSKGLAVARRRQRVGLAALFDIAGAKEAPTAFHLGFLIGPRINAGGRIGESGLGTRLLLTEDAGEASRIAAELDRLNRDRKTIEAEALELAEAEAVLALDGDRGSVLVAAGQGWHPGVVGLVAARLRERFGRPAFAIALSGPIGTGSGRSIPGADLGRAVRAGVDAGLLHRGGGHAMAAGVTIAAEKLASFRDFLHSHFEDTVRRLRADNSLSVDAILDSAAGAKDLAEALDRAGPFGAGNPEPVVALSFHRVIDIGRAGDNHLRMTLAANDGSRIRAIGFRLADTVLAERLMATRGRSVHVAGILSLNRWGGESRVELRLLDASLASADHA